MKFICIKHDNIEENTGKVTPAPKLDEIVTLDYETDDGYLNFIEYPMYEYQRKNFRPLDEDNFSENILENIKQQVKEENLCNI